MNIGIQFANVENEDGSYEIGESLFAGTATEGDQIITLDADAWNLNQSDKQGPDLGWILYPANGGSEEYFQTIKQKKGDLFYFIPVNADEMPTVTVSGQVAKLGEQTVVFDVENEDEQWMFPLVNPFPVTTTWGELNTFTKEGDQIVALDADAWNLNQYDRLGDGKGWVLYPADGNSEEYFTDESSIALQEGEAAYYIPVETVTWTVTL